MLTALAVLPVVLLVLVLREKSAAPAPEAGRQIDPFDAIDAESECLCCFALAPPSALSIDRCFKHSTQLPVKVWLLRAASGCFARL